MMKLNQSKLVAQLSKIAIYFVVFWILFLLGRSLWQNWDLKKSIGELNNQIATLEQQKKDLENLNLYYATDSFKELEARRELGLKKPDEKVVILPQTTPTAEATPANFSAELNQEKAAVAGVEAPSKISNWLLWWQYFTK